MRQGVTGTRTDNGPVAVVGLGMALTSTLVALSGLTLPLPDVVYRVAAELGAVVEAVDPFDGGSGLRMTPLTGGVVLRPPSGQPCAPSGEGLRSACPSNRWPRRRGGPRGTIRRRVRAGSRSLRRAAPGSSARASAPHSSPPAERPGAATGVRPTRCACRHERHEARRWDEARGRRRDEPRDQRRDDEEEAETARSEGQAEARLRQRRNARRPAGQDHPAGQNHPAGRCPTCTSTCTRGRPDAGTRSRADRADRSGRDAGADRCRRGRPAVPAGERQRQGYGEGALQVSDPC